MRKLFGIFLALPLLGLMAFMGCQGINFNRYCGGHLARAAHANTVDLAEQELETALAYIESHGMTAGFTSVIYETPDQDVGFWYQNLKASLEELKKVQPEATQLERSNVLLKLRETLLTHNGEGGESVITPRGISLCPSNKPIAAGLIFFVLLALSGVKLATSGRDLYGKSRFTLIEVMIVVAIIGILLAVATTAFMS